MSSDQQTLWIKVVESDIAGLKTYTLPLLAILVLGSCVILFFTLRWIRRRGLKSTDAFNLACANRTPQAGKR